MEATTPACARSSSPRRPSGGWPASRVFALWLIISTGAVVRLTRSGLGCEHWPGCEPGQPFPEKDYHAYIEFGNRMVARRDDLPDARASPSAPGSRAACRAGRAGSRSRIFAGTLAQAPLGAITVYANLHPALVIPHLLLSVAVLGAAVVVGLEAVALGREQRSRSRGAAPRRAAGSPIACFLLLASGTSLRRQGRIRAARTSTGSGGCARRCCCTAPSWRCSGAA